MKQYFKILTYCFSILSAFLIICWIIWTRFLRTRIIKDIPMMLTEYGFWLLCYVCFIYLVTIIIILLALYKKQITKMDGNNAIKELMNKCYIPFIMLDHLMKYNNYLKDSYCNSMIIIIKFFKTITKSSLTNIILIFEIIPRIFLVSFLILDTFYFHKLETLYKIILLGLLPFIFKYIKYNFNDFKEHYIEVLENRFKYILMFETNTNNDEDSIWDLHHNNEFHNKRVQIKKYIEFKIRQQVYYEQQERLFDEELFAQDHFQKEYKKKNNIPENKNLSEKDLKNIYTDFQEYIKIICDAAMIYDRISYFQNKKIILYLRLIICLSYFICWGYIIITSYYNHPIELVMFKYLLLNSIYYLFNYDLDPFTMLNQYSINTNLITPQSIKNLITNSIEFIITKIKKIINEKFKN